jgi:hypothetical protein
VQAIALARVLLGESRDVAGDGTQFESDDGGRLPELERHATRISGQHLSVSGIGFAAAQSSRETVDGLGIQHCHFDSRRLVQGQGEVETVNSGASRQTRTRSALFCNHAISA